MESGGTVELFWTLVEILLPTAGNGVRWDSLSCSGHTKILLLAAGNESGGTLELFWTLIKIP
jgi:hypothetical protein